MPLVAALHALKDYGIHYKRIKSKHYRVIIRIPLIRGIQDSSIVRAIENTHLKNMKTFDGTGEGFGYREWFFT